MPSCFVPTAADPKQEGIFALSCFVPVFQTASLFHRIAGSIGLCPSSVAPCRGRTAGTQNPSDDGFWNRAARDPQQQGISCSRQARRRCDPFRSEFRRLSTDCTVPQCWTVQLGPLLTGNPLRVQELSSQLTAPAGLVFLPPPSRVAPGCRTHPPRCPGTAAERWHHPSHSHAPTAAMARRGSARGRPTSARPPRASRGAARGGSSRRRCATG